MLNISKPLLRRSPILPDESPLSFLVRVSLLNTYPPNMVIELCKERLGKPHLNLSRSLTFEALQIMSDLTLLEATAFYWASVHRFTSIISPLNNQHKTVRLPSGEALILAEKNFLRHHIRNDDDLSFCPRCLAEARYHRICWMPLALNICLKHQTLLLQKCPRCRSRVTMVDLLQAQCDGCGCDLTQAPTISVADDDFGLFSQTMIHSWLFGNALPETPYQQLPDHPPHVLYRLLDGLRSAVSRIKHTWDFVHTGPFNEEVSIFPCDRKNRLIPGVAYRLYCTAFKGIADWPRGFHRFVGAYQYRDGRQLKGKLHKDLGSLHMKWWLYWKEPEFQFIQEAYIQYLVDNYTNRPSALRGRRGLHEIVKTEFPYISEEEAIESLNTTIKVIKQLIQAKILVRHADAEQSVEIRQVRMVRRAEVERIRKGWQESLPLAETVLGASEKMILDLAKAKLLLATNEGSKANDGYDWMIRLESITDFLTSLDDNTRSLHLTKKWHEIVDLKTAVDRMSEFEVGVAAIIEKVLVRELRAECLDGEIRLDKLRIVGKDIELWMEGIRTNRPLLTHSQVAWMMDAKISNIKYLVYKEHLLKPTRREGKILFFDRDEVYLFRENYISGWEAARLLGIGRSSAMDWARKVNLPKIKIQNKYDADNYFFRREDFKRFLKLDDTFK